LSPDATRKHHPLSRLAADARYAAGHPSEPQTAADTRDGYQHQPGHRRRTPAVRGVVVREAADGQSADGAGSLQLPLLSSRPALRAAACGGRPRAGNDTTETGDWPTAPLALERQRSGIQYVILIGRRIDERTEIQGPMPPGRDEHDRRCHEASHPSSLRQPGQRRGWPNVSKHWP
jgi:hypothetical protein